jgi:hydroxymethylpyrimidine/phosphomethylpyrimidine kinase
MAFKAAHMVNMPVWVMNHKLDESFLKNMGPDHVAILRKDEPKASRSTMEWIVEQAVNTRGGLPLCVSDDGSLGKEPMIRILARDPEELLRLHRRLHGEKI